MNNNNNVILIMDSFIKKKEPNENKIKSRKNKEGNEKKKVDG